MTENTSASAAGAPVKPSWQTVAGDYVRVLWRPSEVFRRHADTGIARPFVVAAAGMAIVGATGLPVLMRNQLFLLPPGASAPGPLATLLLAVVTGLIMAALTMVVNGAIVWLGAKSLGASLRWRQAAVIALFSSVVIVLTLIVTALIALIPGVGPDAAVLSLSLSDLLPDEGVNPVVEAVAVTLGVISIWSSVLFAIAARTIGGGRTSLPVAVAVYWALHFVLSLAMTLVMNAVPLPEEPTATVIPGSAGS